MGGCPTLRGTSDLKVSGISQVSRTEVFITAFTPKFLVNAKGNYRWLILLSMSIQRFKVLYSKRDMIIIYIIIRHDIHNPTSRLQYTELGTAH